MWQIIGAGAIGCLWAANLLRTGHQVHLVSRNTNKTKLLKYQDLQGNNVVYDCSYSTQLINQTSPILVCVKAQQVEQALANHRHFIGPEQVIILMHNGMGCAEQVAEFLPNNPIICATTANASLLNGHLNISQTGIGITYLGAFNEQAKIFSYLAVELNHALNNCHWCEDIQHKLWLKLLINIAINPLTAIFQINNGKLAGEKFKTQIEQIITEAMPLLKALGLCFEKADVIKTIYTVITTTATNYSSMNRDIHYKRLTENEYINGYLLKKASQLKIVTPLIQSLYEQIKVLENHSPTLLNTE